MFFAGTDFDKNKGGLKVRQKVNLEKWHNFCRKAQCNKSNLTHKFFKEFINEIFEAM